jgi:hypothetical protein
LKVQKVLDPIPLHPDLPSRVDEPTATARDRIPREENRVLREQLGSQRLRLNNDQRRRLAAKAKGLGRRLLAKIATLVTPETLLACSHVAVPADSLGNGYTGLQIQRRQDRKYAIVFFSGYLDRNRVWATNELRSVRL